MYNLCEEKNASPIGETLYTLYVIPVDQWKKVFPLSCPVLLQNWRLSCQNPVDQWKGPSQSSSIAIIGIVGNVQSV